MERTVFGQPSLRISSDRVELWVTRLGGHVAPVSHRFEDRIVQPYSIAPWAPNGRESGDAPSDLPPVLAALRGDFFCLPFGANTTPYHGERHPMHGESANREWKVVSHLPDRIEMEIELRIRRGKVVKELRLMPGENAVHSRHRLIGISGPMTIGHHAMLKFSSRGLIGLPPLGFGQVFPGEFERPADGGYSSLSPGATFSRLDAVPSANGGTADLSEYPAREGFEDLVMVFPESRARLGWSTVVFPNEGYVWFCLRDPKVLAGTVLWHSNGGRHYAPWNGRHRSVLGIEEITGYFHFGLAESTQDNDIRRAGYPTFVELKSDADFVVDVITGVAAVPPGFERVVRVEHESGLLTLADAKGNVVHTPLSLPFSQ